MSRLHIIVSFLAIMSLSLGVGVLVNVHLSGVDTIGPSPASSFAYLIALYVAILIPTGAAIIIIHAAVGDQWAGYVYVITSLIILITSLPMNETHFRGEIGLLLIYSAGLLMFSLYYLFGVFRLHSRAGLRS